MFSQLLHEIFVHYIIWGRYSFKHCYKTISKDTLWHCYRQQRGRSSGSAKDCLQTCSVPDGKRDMERPLACVTSSRLTDLMVAGLQTSHSHKSVLYFHFHSLTDFECQFLKLTRLWCFNNTVKVLEPVSGINFFSDI